jgi:hypothetical protein
VKQSRLNGRVQQKLRWVENGVNRYVWVWDCGAGRFYVVFLRVILFLPYFHFRSVLPIYRRVLEKWVKLYERRSASPIKALYRIVISATLLPALKGEAGRLCHTKRRSAANSQH